MESAEMGRRAMQAEEMLPLLETALKQQHYPLVMWQTGTVEAVRGLQPDRMLDVLHTGAELVRDSGGDLDVVGVRIEDMRRRQRRRARHWR